MAKPSSSAKFLIQKFDPITHDRKKFSCGYGPIDNFFKQSISKLTKDNLIAVWVAVERGQATRPFGFYSLNAHSVVSNELPQLMGRSRQPSLPAVYLGAIAVDQTAQSKGLGTALQIDAIKRSVTISQQAGCAAIILDVLDTGDQENFTKRTSFYENLGFQFIDKTSHNKRMFLSIKNAEASLE